MNLHNDYRDRQRIRNDIIWRASMPGRDFTPVLLMFWTKESLGQFLIPCTSEELKKLRSLNGVDENGTPGWEQHRETLQFLKNKISLNYEDGDGEEHPEGEWRERYFIDTHDEEGRPLPPVTLPTGTILVVTGFIL